MTNQDRWGPHAFTVRNPENAALRRDGTRLRPLRTSDPDGGRITESNEPLVAEGVETALSLASGLLRAPATVWATLSASGMAGLRLPERPGQLTVATDGDEAGRAAGYALAERATALGWTVALLPAPSGRDWNDVLAKKGTVA
jgi:hypothetical protein